MLYQTHVMVTKQTGLEEKRKWDFTSKSLVSQFSYFFFAEFAVSGAHVMLLPSDSVFVLTCCELGINRLNK